MFEIFKIKYGNSMLASFTLQQLLAAASSWALVDFIRETANPNDFHISKLVVLLVIAVSPYIPGFIANYYYHLWSAYSRSVNVQMFISLIDEKTQGIFDTKKKDGLFALQREHLSLLEETTRFFYLNFPVVLNLAFNSIAIGFLLGKDIIFGMLAGLVISALQVLLVPFLTKDKHKKKQENSYEAERSLLGSWQVLTLKNQPFYQNSLAGLFSLNRKSESLSKNISSLEAATNILVLVLSFCPLTGILLSKFQTRELDHNFLLSLGVLLPRILQIFNMSSNLILAGQSLQALRIKWISFQERLVDYRSPSEEQILPSEKVISVVDVGSRTNFPLVEILAARANGRFLVKGPNGSGKSTLCLKLKNENDNSFYLPAKFENPFFNNNGSTGENKLTELKWLAENASDYEMILLDEWDANLDAEATDLGDSLIQEISERCLVFEVRHKEKIDTLKIMNL